MDMFKNNIICLILSCIVLLNIETAIGQDKVVDQVVAVVGNNPILKSDIETSVLQKQAQGMTTLGDMK
jgi:peptidyl-prolyl cis-trans isomerase SurA